MTEQEQVESGQEAQEPQGEPKPVFASQQKDTQTLPKAEVDLDTLLADPRMEEFLDRKLQSMKDKRFSQIERKLDSLAGVDIYEAYREKGLSPDEAKKQMQIDELLNERQSKQTPVSQPESKKGIDESWTEVQKAMLEKAGIADNDLGLHQLASSKQWENPSEWMGALTEFVVKRSVQSPNESVVIQPSGGAVGSEPTYDELAEELSVIQKTPSNKLTASDKKRRVEIREKMKKLAPKVSETDISSIIEKLNTPDLS